MKEKKRVELQLPTAPSRKEPTPLAVTGKRRKGDTGVRVSEGNSDAEALTSLITDWVVPLLVKEFLAEHQAKTTVNSGEPTNWLVTKEGAAGSRIRY